MMVEFFNICSKSVPRLVPKSKYVVVLRDPSFLWGLIVPGLFLS